MRKSGLRLVGALAGVLPFVLGAGQAASAQPYTTGPPPAQPSLADQVAVLQREYCDAVAKARTRDEIQRVLNGLRYNFGIAAGVAAEEKRAAAGIAQARARMAEDELMLAQRRAASPLGEIDGAIRTDRQIIAETYVKAKEIDARGVNGGPNLSEIDEHIREYTIQVKEAGPSQRPQAERELAQWQAKRNELMAAKAPLADSYNNARNDLDQQQARRAAAEAAFDQANAQFKAQIEERKREIGYAQDYAKSSREKTREYAPYLQGRQSLANAVNQCAHLRLAQIQGTTPPPYAPPQAPPGAVAGAPLAGQVRWTMNCTPDQGVFTSSLSGQLTLVIGADGAFSGTGPAVAGLALQVTGQIDATGVVRGTITDVQGSYLDGTLDRSTAQGAGRLGFNNPGGWGVCAGEWRFSLQ